MTAEELSEFKDLMSEQIKRINKVKKKELVIQVAFAQQAYWYLHDMQIVVGKESYTYTILEEVKELLQGNTTIKKINEEAKKRNEKMKKTIGYKILHFLRIL
jgi:hypothetical protein